MNSDEYHVSYAQNREDVIIGAFFSDIKKGFYVDVGANHPFRHSVTHAFYKAGWRGINYEPNPKLFKLLTKTRPRDMNIQSGIGEASSKLSLRVYHTVDGLEGIATLSPDMKQDYSSLSDPDHTDYSDVTIPVVTLKDSLGKLQPPHIHFMKIDVEGFEYEVIAGNDWKKYRPELLCIEANHIKHDWKTLLAEVRYRLVFNDGLNDYYLAEESMVRAKGFDYAQIFLSNKPVIPYEIANHIERTATENAELKERLVGLEKLAEQKQAEIESLVGYLRQITPIHKHILHSVGKIPKKLKQTK